MKRMGSLAYRKIFRKNRQADQTVRLFELYKFMMSDFIRQD